MKKLLIIFIILFHCVAYSKDRRSYTRIAPHDNPTHANPVHENPTSPHWGKASLSRLPPAKKNEVVKLGYVLQKANRTIDPNIEFYIAKYAEKHNVSSYLVTNVIRVESNFNPYATSHKGAKGLMQLMDATASDCGISDPYDIEQNISCGVHYLSKKIEDYGDIKLALAAYNAGDKSIERYGGVPPYKETQDYIKKILE